MSIRTEPFGVTKRGEKATLYLLSAGALELGITDYGAAMVSLKVPDREGVADDVLLGYDRVSDYEEGDCFFGAVIWPSANRMSFGRCPIGEKVFRLPVNEGENNLHTDHENGSHRRIWTAEIISENKVRFRMDLRDGEFGLPGNRTMQIIYTLTESGTVRLEYQGTSDAETLINATNHAYFNLAGHSSGTVLDQTVKIHAARYTPLGKGSIPTGQIAPVRDTPMDLTKGIRIGDKIDAPFEQLRQAGGYDHNFVLDGWCEDEETLLHAAEVTEPLSGRKMKVFTTLPGVQFYTGNYLEGIRGKNGAVYGKRAGLCLETQYFPDSLNHKEFFHPVFGPEKDYRSVTEIRFCTENP